MDKLDRSLEHRAAATTTTRRHPPPRQLERQLDKIDDLRARRLALELDDDDGDPPLALEAYRSAATGSSAVAAGARAVRAGAARVRRGSRDPVHEPVRRLEAVRVPRPGAARDTSIASTRRPARSASAVQHRRTAARAAAARSPDRRARARHRPSDHSRSAVPAGTSAVVGLVADTSTSRWLGAAPSPRSRRSPGPAARRGPRARRRRSPARRRITATSRSGRSASATPIVSGHPSTAIGSSCGKGSKDASRAAVRSGSRRPMASGAAGGIRRGDDTRAQSHHSGPHAGWCASRRRHTVTSCVVSGPKSARQSAASSTRSVSSPAWRASARSRSKGKHRPQLHWSARCGAGYLAVWSTPQASSPPASGGKATRCLRRGRSPSDGCRLVALHAWLLGEAEHALADDVPHHLVGAAGDAHAGDAEHELRPGVRAPLAAVGDEARAEHLGRASPRCAACSA